MVLLMIIKDYDMAFIELKDITFAYDEGENVLSGFNLLIEEGECVFVRGDNGSGKSTLFRILTGISYPASGIYKFDGEEINKKYLKDNRNSKLFHKRVGYLFQNPDIMLFSNTVFDDVAFGPRQIGLGDKEVLARTEDILKTFDIEELRDKAPYHLSGGQKKKVALAAVFALNPEVILLDEPLAGLDKKGRGWLVEFLKEVKSSGKTLIIATHSDEIEAELDGRVCEL